MKIKRLILASSIFIFSGCAVYHGGSFVSADLPQNKAQLIVEKIVERLVAVYPPGRTALGLDLIQSDPFGQQLEGRLRAQGFKLLSPQDSEDALLLNYTIDSIQDEEALIWYVHVRMSDGFSFAQVYDLGSAPKALGGVTQIIPAGD